MEPAPEITVTAGEPQGGLGDVVTDGAIEFVVTDFECGHESLSDGGWDAPEGQYCLVELTVTNTGEASRRYSYANQVLIDDQGNRYRASFVGIVASIGTAHADLFPGATIEVSLPFDVPADLPQGVFVAVELHDSLLSSGVLVALK